jgi:hypothetical protein
VTLDISCMQVPVLVEDVAVAVVVAVVVSAKADW